MSTLRLDVFRENDFPEYALGTKLPGLDIEIRNPKIPRGVMRSAIFDFDGTVSLVRAGWQDVMIPMMVEKLVALDTGEAEQALYNLVEEFVVTLTGKQTIYQMMRLADEIESRGGQPDDPATYKDEYLQRLGERIDGRLQGLAGGTVVPEEMCVPGALELVQNLTERGISLYLASGTDIEFVRQEAELLGVAEYFEPHIYGALELVENFSKKMVIAQILRENNLHGAELVAFGDGYVEIMNAKEAGGCAVGVASNEYTREGVNHWKRNRLVQAGADIIVPEFRQWRELVAYLMAED